MNWWEGMITLHTPPKTPYYRAFYKVILDKIVTIINLLRESDHGRIWSE